MSRSQFSTFTDKVVTDAHVSRSSDEGVGYRIDELPRNSKITYLDLSFRVEKDVGGFDIYKLFEQDINH